MMVINGQCVLMWYCTLCCMLCFNVYTQLCFVTGVTYTITVSIAMFDTSVHFKCVTFLKEIFLLIY